jgi:hypothetical protein
MHTIGDLTMTRKLLAALLVALFAACHLALAQTAHYPNGVEGIKAASLPPPGIYLRDYNYLYFADEFPEGPPGFDLLVYVQAPRVIWISPWKFLGGSYGADALFPFAYQDLKTSLPMSPNQWDDFNLGDIFVEPATLSWHTARFDVGVGYGFWAPTGDFDRSSFVNPGKGYWGHMLTAGATFYFDKEKSWAISALNRYEINHENPDTDITPGHAWTIEWGFSKTFRKTIDVGLVGYYQAQTTTDSGPGTADDRDAVVALGPEVNFFFPKIMFFASARYLYELEANDRPQGHTLNFTLTKRF